MSAVLEAFVDVEGCAAAGDWSACLSACRKAADECPEHKSTAQRCQLICLLKQGSFQEALDLLKRIDDQHQLSFETAYALFGLKRYQEAVNYCGDDFRDHLLKAQIYYELEDYASSMKEYEWLLNAEEFEKYTDSNVTAVEACLQFQQNGFQPRHLKTIDEEDADSLYNHGCLHLINSNLEEAERSFRSCEKRMAMEEDADITSPRFQLAVVSQLKGDLALAKERYRSLQSCSASNAVLATLAIINTLLVNEEDISPDSLRKKLKRLSDKVKNANAAQRLCLSFNEKLISAEAGHDSDIRSYLKSVGNSKLQGPCQHLYLTWLVKQKKYNEALELLKDRQGEDVMLLRAKVLAAQGSFLRAAEILRSTGNVRWVPVICDLYSKANDTSKLKEYVSQLLDGGQVQLVTRISRSISRLPAVKKDSALLGTLQSSIELPSLTDVFGNLTVEDVERSLQAADTVQRKRQKAMLGQEKPKRRRKNKPPKSTDKPIDPERWLPLKERSYYKHARRRLKQQHAVRKRSTQGAVETTESEQWLGDRTPLTPGTAMHENMAATTAQPKKLPNAAKAARSKRKKREKW